MIGSVSDKKKILLIDDEKEFVELLAMRLRASNYEVVPAFDGEEGLGKVRSERPDLVILDLMLPKIDGAAVYEHLKKDAEFSKIPVVLLSAKDRFTEEEIGKIAGGDVFIAKPFEPRELLVKIRELIRGSEG